MNFWEGNVLLGTIWERTPMKNGRNRSTKNPSRSNNSSAMFWQVTNRDVLIWSTLSLSCSSSSCCWRRDLKWRLWSHLRRDWSWTITRIRLDPIERQTLIVNVSRARVFFFLQISYLICFLFVCAPILIYYSLCRCLFLSHLSLSHTLSSYSIFLLNLICNCWCWKRKINNFKKKYSIRLSWTCFSPLLCKTYITND